MAPARGARRPHRGHGLAAVRARPPRVRVAPAHRRRPAAPRGRAGRGAAAALRRGRAPGARARRARPLLRDGRRPGRRATAPSASSRARARAARSSSSARRCSPCSATGAAPEGIGIVCPTRRALARPARDGASARSGSRTWSRARSRSGATAVRPRAARAPALRLARRRPARPVRVPALAVLGLAAGAPPTSSRAASAAARVADPPRVLEEETERLRGQPLPGAGGAARRRRSGRRRARARDRRCSARAYGVDAPPGDRRRSAATCARTSRSGSCSTELDGLRALGGGGRRARTSPPRSSGTTLRVAPRRPGRVAVLDLLRARTRRFDVVFVLGLEEGSLPRRGGGTPFLDEDARRDARRRAAPGSLRADPVSRDRYLFYTACTRATQRLTSSARPRATRAARASRARSGTRSRRCSTPEEVDALDALAARSPR